MMQLVMRRVRNERRPETYCLQITFPTVALQRKCFSSRCQAHMYI